MSGDNTDDKVSEDRNHHPSVKIPEAATQSASDYFATAEKGRFLFHFIIDQAMYGDFVQHTAKAALAPLELDINDPRLNDNSDLHITPAKLLETNPGPRIKALRRVRQELLELFLASATNNFQTYVVSILREVLRKQPKILRERKQTVTIEYVLQFESIGGLTNDLIEGKVNSLSFEGFNALQEWCSEKVIPLAVPKDISETVVELIATRNTIVHNRGHEKYLRTVKNSKFRRGEKRKITVDDYLEAEQIFERIVIATDQEAVVKYGLESSPLSPQTLDLLRAYRGAHSQ
jgi:hypothetical protein